MKEILKLKRIYLLLLFPISALIIVFAKINNVWVEKVFFPFVYKPLSFVIGWFISLFPFSVTEIILLLLPFLIAFYIYKMYKKPLIILTDILCSIAVLFFLFEITMGLNYYRYEAKHYLGLEITKSSKEDLYNLCEILVEDINSTRPLMQKDENGVALLSDKSRLQTSESAKEAYKKLSEKYPFLKSADIKSKPLIFSRFMSRFLTTGIYMPYTFESTINVDVSEFTIPFTMCHELTHYRGFMRENEANFLGYLACMQSDRADFRYSASVTAFRFVFPKLYDEDAKLAMQLRDRLDSGVVNDIAVDNEYWKKYKTTTIAEISDKVYDSYLNFNGQTSGLKSYGEMVDLLIAYYKSE